MTDTSAPLELASGFTPATYEKWRQLVDKALKGADFERRLVATTADGLRIEPLYSRADTLPGAQAAVPGKAPFTRGTTGMNYVGDMTNRVVKISNSQSIADGHSGADVFMNIPEGNGLFRAAVTATNTGSGTIDVGRVVNSTQWVPDNYSLQFTTATDWQVVDDTLPVPNVITSGTGFTSGQSISFLGTSVTVTGAPAAGDSFSITPAQKTDMFAMLEQLAATLGSATTTPVDKATFQAQIGASIANLDQSLNRTSVVRAEVGSRLNAIDMAADTRGAESVDLQDLLSDLRDVDYAEAVSRLNQQYTGLQAAQQAYTKIAQLSLFDYL